MQQAYLIENATCEACYLANQPNQSNQSNELNQLNLLSRSSLNKILCPVTLGSCGHTICTKCAIQNLHVKKNGMYHTGCPICQKISEFFVSRCYSLGTKTTAHLYYDFIGSQTQIIHKDNLSQIQSITNKYIALEIKENYPNKPEFKYVYIGKCSGVDLDETDKVLLIQFSECYLFSEQNNIIYPVNPFDNNYKINLQNNNINFLIKVGSN